MVTVHWKGVHNYHNYSRWYFQCTRMVRLNIIKKYKNIYEACSLSYKKMLFPEALKINILFIFS